MKDLEDFFVAGRNAPTLLILGTLVASFMSTNAFMGEAGMSYQGHAPLIIMMTCFNCLGYVLGAIFFGRYLRRSRALTVPDFFQGAFQQSPYSTLCRYVDCRWALGLFARGDLGYGAGDV